MSLPRIASCSAPCTARGNPPHSPRRYNAFPMVAVALIGIAVAAPFPAGNAAADPLFQAAFESYDVGPTQAFGAGLMQGEPTGVAAVDMNADGLTDLVVACPNGPGGVFTGNTVSVLLRSGNTTAPPVYQTKINSQTGTSTGPIALAVGDINGDGKQDVVTADYGSNTISILIGDGQGHLTFIQAKVAGTHPRGVALGDFNNDGKQDVVAANSGSNTISVWLNVGGGQMGPRTDVATPTEPRAVVVGLFNGDAALDVVSCNYLGGTISLFTNQNNGTGALNTPVNIPVGNKPTALATGLLDANGTTDVAVACSSRVVTRLSNGVGGFGGGISVVVPVNPLAITVANVTGGALQDIAVAGISAAGAPNVAVIQDVSSASFIGVITARGGPTPWGIAYTPDPSALVVANTGDMSAADPTHTVSLLRQNPLTNGFGSSQDLLGGARADQIAVADLNKNGIPDLIIGGQDANGLYTANGVGDGTFAAPVAIAGSADASWVGAIDANRDGNVDILYGCPSAAELRIAMSNGIGGFNAPTAATPGWMDPCLLGDFNRDGITDIVATSGASYRVFLGSGTSLFTALAPVGLVGPSAIRALTAGDWNRDGKLDLAVSTDTGVSRYLGFGDGTFTSAATFLSGHSVFGGAFADVNRDGWPDLVVSDAGTSPVGANTPQGVTVLPGDGLGNFGSPLLFPSLDVAKSIAVADVNRDGRPDVVAKNSFSPDQQTVSVLLGDGGGNLGARTDYGANSNALGMALADLDRDGRIDVAGAGQGNNGAPAGIVSVLRGAIGGSFGSLGAKTDYGNVGVFATATDGADVNGDGKADVVLVGTISGSPYAGTLVSDGAGTFIGGSVAPMTGVDPRSVVIADMNRDGRLDLVIGNGNAPSCYVMLGSFSTFGPPLARATNNGPPNYVAVGDLNRDGILDVVAGSPSSASLSILIGDGTGNFAAPVSVSTVNGITGVAIGDFNNDGLPDIVSTGGGTGSMRLHLQQSNGTFAMGGQITIGANPSNPVFGDFNRDGWLDVAVGGSGAGGKVSVIINNGSGGLPGGTADYALFSPPTQLRVADMNGDGALDLIASISGGVAVLLGAGGPGGGFGPAATYTAASAVGLCVVDMNRDGRPDVVAANGPELTASVFLNGGSVPTGVAVGDTPSARPLLSQNAPNPFNPRTEIRFALPRAGQARLVVYDAAGRRVATLLDGPALAGERRIEWSGRDDAGRPVASGIYFYQLEADGVSLSRRMALLK